MRNNMLPTILVVLLVFDTLHVEPVFGCTISSGWTSLEMNERLLLSDIVVYGRTTQHVANRRKINDRTVTFIDAVFEVLCVLKPDEDPVEPEILIERISPRDGCSGTRKNMQIQQETIVALKRTTNGNYQYHEVVPTLSATFTPARAAFYSIAGTCGLQTWVPPSNSVNRCPVCGIADFSQDAVDADETIAAPCTIDKKFDASNEGCEMYIAESYSNTSMCLPDDYGTTCIRLSYQTPTATCECTEVKHTNDGFLDVGKGSFVKPSMFAVIGSVLLVAVSVKVKLATVCKQYRHNIC